MSKSVIVSVFADRAEERFASVADERAAIAAAKNGDAQAIEALLLAYAPALRRAVSRAEGSSNAEADDLRQSAMLGLLEAVKAFDAEKHERLAAVIRFAVDREVAEAKADAERTTFSGVAPVVRWRFFRAIREADGDLARAAELAPSFELASSTFREMAAGAFGSTASLDALGTAEDGGAIDVVARPIGYDGRREAQAEAVELCEVAFAAVDETEAAVCRHKYGFADYDPQPDAVVAERLGLSRPKVQRVRASALAKMREAVEAA